MARLINRDLMDVMLVTRAALEHDDLDQMRKEVLGHLEGIFKCDKSTFFLTKRDFRSIDFESVVSRGFEWSYMQRFIDYYYKLDPYVPGLRFRPPVIVTEQIISFNDLVKTEYYNDFLEPQQIYHQMAMVLRTGRRFLGVLAFLRPRSTCDFSGRDMAKADLMAQYLGEILNKNINLKLMSERAAIFESMASGMSAGGKMVLNNVFDPIHLNACAEKIMTYFPKNDRLKEGKEGNSFQIPRQITSCCEELLKLTGATEPGEKTQHFTLELGGRRIKGRIRLVVQKSQPNTFFVTLEPEDPVEDLKACWLDLGLTQREVEVAGLVCRGLQNNEISDNLFISRYTVENHLKSIFTKTGVGNRTSLTHKLLNI